MPLTSRIIIAKGNSIALLLADPSPCLRRLVLRMYWDGEKTPSVVSPLGEPTPMGPVPKLKKFRVVGIFKSGMYEFDAKFAFIDGQRHVAYGHEATKAPADVSHVEHAHTVFSRRMKRPPAPVSGAKAGVGCNRRPRFSRAAASPRGVSR